MMWEKPVTQVEQFAADNYCASVCFTLTCQAGYNGQVYPVVNGKKLDYTEAELWGEYTESYDKTTDTGWYIQEGTGKHATNGTGCNNPALNVISIRDDGTFAVREKSEQQGWLTGIWTGSFDLDNNGEWNAGDLFTWVTIGNANPKVPSDDNRVWRHWAVAGSAIEGRPLMHS